MPRSAENGREVCSFPKATCASGLGWANQDRASVAERVPVPEDPRPLSQPHGGPRLALWGQGQHHLQAVLSPLPTVVSKQRLMCSHWERFQSPID